VSKAHSHLLHNAVSPRQRNLAIDFFRGCALLVIFISHTHNNPWYWYMPTRFGFADAAELFVFCSGLVVAYAFGRTYDKAGFWLGTAKTLRRCLDLYAVHIALVVVYIWLTVEAQQLFNVDYPRAAGMSYFVEQTTAALHQLMNLSYVPNFLDILPMYLLVMASLPLFVLLGRVHPWLAMGASLAVYAGMWIFDWNMVANIETGRGWFFNPFGWQLLFYIAYSIGAGWVKIPPRSPLLLIACTLMFLLVIPVAYFPIHWKIPMFAEWLNIVQPILHKTPCAPLRIMYFLAVAYMLHWWSAEHPDFFHRPLVRWISVAGQQSLTVFAFGTLFSFIAGVLLQQVDYSAWPAALINIGGCALLIAIAFMVRWFKRKPWQLARQQHTTE
jgi:hypothetical protein